MFPDVLHRRGALFAALLIVSLAVTRTVQASDTDRHLAIAGSEHFRITYDSSFTWPDSDGSAKLYLPIPPDTGSQHITSFTSSIKGAVETDDNGHRLLVTTLHPGSSRRVHWRVTITGTWKLRQLEDGPPAADDPIEGPGDGSWLGTSPSINWRDEAFQDWLDDAGLRRRSGESAVDFGQRVYTYFRTHGRYVYPPVSAWNSAACARRLRTDCGGFSLVFVAACRANHIPARLLVGQCFKARRAGDTVALTGGRQAHVIAEFYDPQIGWIPEDISSTFLRVGGFEDLNFFGRDPGYFFAWHTDTDFYFDTPRKADAHVQWIQNPNLWFTENADEANDTVTHHWYIERL
jgi:transglutaminase-like putative cysteine protease